MHKITAIRLCLFNFDYSFRFNFNISLHILRNFSIGFNFVLLIVGVLSLRFPDIHVGKKISLDADLHNDFITNKNYLKMN